MLLRRARAHLVQRGLGPAALGASLAGAWVSTTGAAAASSGLESPDSGVVQTGRGSAWLARADDPLAVYFNPAALAFQTSGVHLGAQLLFMNRCFTRKGDNGAPVSPGNNLPGPGAVATNTKEIPPPAEVCAEVAPSPDPQLAGSFRIADRIAVGVAVVAPHAVGKSTWPESIGYTNRFGIAGTQPAPTRYMLVSSDSKILFPTLAVSYAPTDKLAFGVGLTWGIAIVNFVNFTEGLSTDGANGTTDQFFQNQDVRAELDAKDLFIPGFVLSGLWSAAPNLDVAAWFKWSDAVRTKKSADLRLSALYWQKSGLASAAPEVTDAPGAGSIGMQLPMEAKLALRFHQPRATAQSATVAAIVPPARRVRDPLREDLFDVELDFTWANNSAVDAIEIRFNPGIAVRGTPGFVPENGDLPRKWKDVVGVRLGGDFVVLPSRLALRAGGFFETKGQRDEYLSTDFHVAERIGVAGGATVRVGPVDLSAAYQHTFFGTLDNKGAGAIHALSGDASTDYRSRQAINGGSLKASLNEVGLSGTVRF
jgi:long-chain fatty acid transport protein